MKKRFGVLALLAVVLISFSSFIPKRSFMKAAPTLEWSIHMDAAVHRTLEVFKIYETNGSTFLSVGPLTPGNSISGSFSYLSGYGNLRAYAQTSGGSLPPPLQLQTE